MLKHKFHNIFLYAQVLAVGLVFFAIPVSCFGPDDSPVEENTPSSTLGEATCPEAPGELRLVLRLNFEEAARKGRLPSNISEQQKMDIKDDSIQVLQGRLGQRATIRARGTDLIHVQIPNCRKDEVAQVRALAVEPGSLEFRIVLEPSPDLTDVDLFAERKRLEDWLSAPENQALIGPDLQNIWRFHALLPSQGGPTRPELVRWIPMHEKANKEECEVRVPIEWSDAEGNPQKGLARFMPFSPEAAPFSGEDLKGGAVFQVEDEMGPLPAIGLDFNSEKKAEFEKYTKSNIRRRLAIILNNQVRTAAIIMAPLSGPFISGGSEGFSLDEVNVLILALPSGSLQIPVVLEEETWVSPVKK